jgi:hypothetical protein
MSAMAELWHIVRKDVRQSRWLLAAFIVLVIAATLGAVTRERLLDGNLQWAAGLLLILGPITAASIIQADSPTQADAFWASHPFRRWAMLGAKITMALVFLLLLPLIGQLLGLIAFRVPPSELPTMMLASVVSYGLLLLIAAFVAALTPELRGFVLGLIAFLVAVVAISIAGAELQWSWNPVLRGVLQVLSLGGVVALLAVLYVRRDTRGARALGVAALALMLVAGVDPIGTPARDGTLASLPAPKRTAAVALELRDTAQIARTGQAQFRLRLVGGVDGVHYRLDDMRARFFLHGGGTLDLPARQVIAHTTSPTFATAVPALPGVPPIRTMEQPFVHSMTDVTLDLTDEQRGTLVQGVDSAEFSSDIVVLEPRVLMTLPLKAGAHALADGHEVRIERLGFGASTDVLDLSVKTLAGAGGEYSWMDSENGLLAVVVNAERSEGIGLARGGASANPGLLVLPGAGLQQGTLMFRQPSVRRGEPPPVDDAFLQGASVMLVRWQPTGRYEARATSVPLPPTDFVRRERHAIEASAVFR